MEISTADSYDVFIDFSSTDTRHSFVSHLSAAFRRRKISLFIGEDCTLAAAEAAKRDFQLPESIQSAINASKVFVVVFSENYAVSPLCLETVVTIRELLRIKDGLVVIPVFYGNVTPTIVKEQTEKFGKAFSVHRNSYSDDRIAKWRDGLMQIAGLPRHGSTDQQNESELVEEIVADVYEKLDPTGKIGIYWRLLKIENLIFKKSCVIYRLGIWGMPGIGKTAVAQAVYNQISHEFNTCCLVEDFHKAFHEKGMYLLREEYLEKVLESENLTKPSLIVLDDVCNPMDAESFLGGFNRFGSGSVIIITSRDKQVLNQCQVKDVYEVPSLNEEEAQQLFNRFAFKDKEPKDESLSRKIVKYANGNPRAIHFFVREVKKKKLDEDNVFEKIKYYTPRKLLSIFRSSYDALSDNERNILLDIACFFKDEQIDHVNRILQGCGFFPRVGIERLIERSLLKKSENNTVEMHNLIQDVGREIVCREKNQIMRRRLWQSSIIQSLLEKKEPKGTEVIEGIFLDTTNLSFNVNSMAFENMYNLRLLKIYSPSSATTPQKLHLPDGLQSLPYELRLLHWEHYPLQSLPQDFDPSQLVELILPYSKLENLWKGTKSLAKLKIINLSYSQQLVEVNELSEACNVEEIDLRGCTSLKSIPETSSLKHLKVLNLFGCTNLKRSDIIPNLESFGLYETSSESMVFTNDQTAKDHNLSQDSQ